jgi:hypothetical protein
MASQYLAPVIAYLEDFECHWCGFYCATVVWCAFVAVRGHLWSVHNGMGSSCTKRDANCVVLRKLIICCIGDTACYRSNLCLWSALINPQLHAYIHYCLDKPSCRKPSYHSSLLKLIDYCLVKKWSSLTQQCSKVALGVEQFNSGWCPSRIKAWIPIWYDNIQCLIIFLQGFLFAKNYFAATTKFC